jgi:hypothetical protein
VTTGIEVDDAIFKAFGLAVVSSQHLRMVKSYKRLRDDQKHLMSICYVKVI